MAHSDTMPISTRLELLEKVNRLNLEGMLDKSYCFYYTVTVLYNTVIYRGCKGDDCVRIHEVIEGVPK
jgi:hypothetical protein